MGLGLGLGLGLGDDDDHNSTPKLSLSRLPCKPKQPLQMLTPPLHPSLSVPFQWEEAPGKPRIPPVEPPPLAAAASAPKSVAERSLELPPRLMLHYDDSEVTVMPSPAVVLDGPDAPACTFSFRRGPGSAREGGRFAKLGGCGSFRSSRRLRSWRSFKFVEGEEKKGSFDISQPLGDFFKREKKSNIRGSGRMRSFFLLDFCERFKQAIPWRTTR